MLKTERLQSRMKSSAACESAGHESMRGEKGGGCYCVTASAPCSLLHRLGTPVGGGRLTVVAEGSNLIIYTFIKTNRQQSFVLSHSVI